jgi:hypothetical protein
MQNAKQHAIQDHHFKAEEILTPEMQNKIKSHIKSLNYAIKKS